MPRFFCEKKIKKYNFFVDRNKFGTVFVLY